MSKLDLPPSPIEPPGAFIRDFVQTLELSAPFGDAIHAFVDALLPPSPVTPDSPPGPIEPTVIRDFVLEMVGPALNPSDETLLISDLSHDWLV